MTTTHGPMPDITWRAADDIDKPMLPYRVDLAHDNAYGVIAVCMRVAKRAGWSEDEISVLTREATSGDHEHLQATVRKYFDVD